MVSGRNGLSVRAGLVGKGGWGTPQAKAEPEKMMCKGKKFNTASGYRVGQGIKRNKARGVQGQI